MADHEFPFIDSLLPKGGDGAEAIPPHGMGQIPQTEFHHATSCFKGMALAMEGGSKDKAGQILSSFIDGFIESGNEINPFGYLTAAGILVNAMVLRRIVGDPDPTGRPSGKINSLMVAQDKDTKAVMDTPEMEGFAIHVITQAANWEWEDLNKELVEKATNGPDEFFVDLSFCLLHMFIGIGGIDIAGWRA